MKRLVTKNVKILVLSLIVIYLALQVLGPRIQIALTPNFDTSCYSGRFSFIERVSKNSSCGAGPKGSVGFPFVFNFKYNPKHLNALVFLIDILPAATLLLLLRRKE